MDRTRTVTRAAYNAMMRMWFETRTAGLPVVPLSTVVFLPSSPLVVAVVVVVVVVGLFLCGRTVVEVDELSVEEPGRGLLAVDVVVVVVVVVLFCFVVVS